MKFESSLLLPAHRRSQPWQHTYRMWIFITTGEFSLSHCWALILNLFWNEKKLRVAIYLRSVRDDKLQRIGTIFILVVLPTPSHSRWRVCIATSTLTKDPSNQFHLCQSNQHIIMLPLRLNIFSCLLCFFCELPSEYSLVLFFFLHFCPSPFTFDKLCVFMSQALQQYKVFTWLYSCIFMYLLR